MSNVPETRVKKRNGEYQDVAFDKILHRMKKLGKEAKITLNYTPLAIKVIDQLYDGIETQEIDSLTAEQCIALITKHPDYGILASKVLVSNHQKNTDSSFFTVMEKLYNFKDIHGKQSSLISEDLWNVVQEHGETLDKMLDHTRDNDIDYFGFKTLERAYLMRINGKIVERIQHMWLRVAIGIHSNDIKKVKETYDLMSQKYFTHATPTLFNAGTPRPQLSSCYLIAMQEDSIDGIYNTLKDCAKISKWAGGIGLHIHNIRASGSHIRGTNGTSNGIVPMLRVFNDTARYVDQGGGKRNGSIAIYMEPWHKDIEAFLDMKKNHGDEEARARDLFYAIWISDLFMKRVETDGEWTLLCPDECPGLADVYGDKFEELYTKYETDIKENPGIKNAQTIKARSLWFKILDSQMETGTPYILYKDACNIKSNQKNLGTIKSSNLCTEIVEYSSKDETAVCNLASIGLSKFVDECKNFNYELLHNVAKVVTYNLNKVIDVNFYPTDKTKRSNMLHRPIGIGVQGLADVFALMDVPFHSEEAKQINKDIFETIYHASLECSNEIAKERHALIEERLWVIKPKVDVTKFKDNAQEVYSDKHISLNLAEVKQIHNNEPICGSYSSFTGSPASEGILQFDMWGVSPSERYDWNGLKENIMQYGLRNSLLVAPMPTASTSQILGNNECFEPFTSNIYSRRVLAGDFIVVNKYLMNDLLKLDMWNDDIKNNIIANKGSIQQLTMLPQHIRDKYKIVWEIPMKHILEMAKDRGAYICQSQSLNLWMEDPNYKSMTAMHFYSWKAGLKTGIYYLRRKAKHQPQQFTIEPEKLESTNENENICEMCSG